MALETDQLTENESRNNQFIIVEIFNIELNDGRVLYLTSNNENVEWANNTYIAFPINRERSRQEGGQVVGDMQISLGDSEYKLTKEVFNNISIVNNAFVTVFQSRESIDGNISIGFRQIFRGRIKSINSSPGIITFSIVAPFSDPQKPVNDKKFGEFEDMIDVFRQIF